MSKYSDLIEAEPSLAGYWKLDEVSGTVAADSSGNGNNGTISGTPTMGANGLVFEPSGKCIDFDGTDDVVTIAPATIAGSAVSFECWVGTSAAASTNIYLADGNPNRFTFAWNTTTSGQLGVYDGTSWSDFGAANNDGKGHHIVFVLDGTTAKCFVDSVQLGTSQTIAAVDWSAITAMALGRDYTAASNYFTGKYQKAAIYNTALTPLQIRQHYQAGIAQGFHKEVLTLNPVAYYPLNEASGDAIDWSGNDNNGTLNGGVTQGVAGALAYDASTAYSFDGVDDFVQTDWSAVTSTDWSLSVYVTPTVVEGGAVYNAIVHSPSGANTAVFYLKGPTFNFWDGGDNLFTPTAVAGITYHTVLVKSGTNLKLYVDGILDATQQTIDVNSHFGDSTVTFADDSTHVQQHNCILQNIAYFDTALTAAQIRTLYQSGKTLIESRGYPKVISNLTPTGYWRLGEASGTTAFDESGNGNDGTINGSPVMATAVGALHQSRLKAMTFDGVNDFVQTTYAGQTGSTARTLLAWVKPSSLAVINPVASYGTNTAADMFQFTIETDGKIKLDINGADAKGSTVLAVDTYYLIAAVLTGTDVNSIDLYVNAVVETEVYTAGATVLTTASSVNMRVGQDIGATLFFSGDMGDVAEIASALTAQQIKQIYEAGKSRYAAEVISYQPVNYFRQNEVSGNAIDLGSLANDGIWTGSPSYEQASEVIANEPNNKSIAVTTSESLAFTSHAATTTYSLLSIIKPTGVAGSQAIFTDGTDSLKLNGAKLGLFYSATDHDANTTLVAGEAHMVGVSVDAGAATFYLDGAPDGTAASATSFAPIKLYDFTFAGTGDEAAVFGTDLTDEQYLDIYEMASFKAITTFGITGLITESLSATEFFVRASQLDDGTFIGDAVMLGDNTYTLDFKTIPGYSDYTDEVLITAIPKTGKRRLNSTAYSVGDYYLPADVSTNDHIYKVTVAGTTAASEPVLDQSGGTTVDGGVTVQDMGVCPTPITQISYPEIIEI